MTKTSITLEHSIASEITDTIATELRPFQKLCIFAIGLNSLSLDKHVFIYFENRLSTIDLIHNDYVCPVILVILPKSTEQFSIQLCANKKFIV